MGIRPAEETFEQHYRRVEDCLITYNRSRSVD